MPSRFCTDLEHAASLFRSCVVTFETVDPNLKLKQKVNLFCSIIVVCLPHLVSVVIDLLEFPFEYLRKSNCSKNFRWLQTGLVVVRADVVIVNVIVREW